MAHPIIEHAARELPDRGYRAETVRASADQPAQLLVQIAPNSDDGGERWALLTVFEDLGASLSDAHLLQIFVGLRAEAGPPERRGDLARLIMAVNNRIAVGQFCFREEDALLYFRAVVMLPLEPEEWATLIDQHLVFSTFQIDEFGALIESVATGARSLDQAMRVDTRLGTLT